MQLLSQFTSDALQQQTIVLPDGSTFFIEVYYRPLQYGWFINTLVYGAFTLNGLRITNSPNFLHQFRNQLPFGLACSTEGFREPTQLQDFSSGAAQLFLLNADDVAQFTEYLVGG